MRSALVAATLLAASAVAQRTTVALGAGLGSVVLQLTTDADGDPSTRTLSTITPTTTATTALQTTALQETTQDAAGGGGNRKGIQAPPTTTYPPMTATTYDIDGEQFTWANSFTPPTEVTTIWSEGHIPDATAWISSAQSNLATIEDNAMKTYKADGNGSGSKSGALKPSLGVAAGWASMLISMGAAFILL